MRTVHRFITSVSTKWKLTATVCAVVLKVPKPATKRNTLLGFDSVSHLPPRVTNESEKGSKRKEKEKEEVS